MLEGVEAEGFRLGTISALGPADFGDAFIIAPDGSRAGLVWELGDSEDVHEAYPPSAGRWGVWNVELPHRMTSSAAAQRNLEAIVPRLRDRWSQWRSG